MALFFLAATVLQYNDPDPMYWMLLYGGTTAVTLTLERRASRGWQGAALLGLSVALIQGSVQAWELTKPTPSAPLSELWSELGGCLLIVIWLAWLIFKKEGKSHAS